jgi:hypothetical protein
MLASSLLIEMIRSAELPYFNPLTVFSRALARAGQKRWMRWFACWCAWRALSLAGDPRCISALYVAQRFARGQATQEELLKAQRAAEQAQKSADMDGYEKDRDEILYRTACAVADAAYPQNNDWFAFSAATQAIEAIMAFEEIKICSNEEYQRMEKREITAIHNMMIRITKKIEKGIHQ